jgi:putative acetyltransferase
VKNGILDVLLLIVYFGRGKGRISMQNKEVEAAQHDNLATPQNSYSVRRATPEDLQTAFQLVEEYFREVGVLVRDTRTEFANHLRSNKGGVWLAIDRGQPIGCIVLHSLASVARSGEIKRLYVRASYRRQGLADRLLGALEQYAVRLPYEWLYLDTKDDLHSAIRFYRRHGYERCGRYNSNPQATIFMRKRLVAVSSATRIKDAASSDYGQSAVLIRSFQSEDAVDFRLLNEEWITRHFRLEEKDSRTLSDPGQYILSPGGYIAMAMVQQEAVGCCALIRLDDTSFEVAKMAVTPAWQGQGLGRKLLEHVIQHARELKAKRLYLETNSTLVPAIRLYESLGFCHLPAERVTRSPYRRADVYMELFLE